MCIEGMAYDRNIVLIFSFSGILCLGKSVILLERKKISELRKCRLRACGKFRCASKEISLRIKNYFFAQRNFFPSAEKKISQQKKISYNINHLKYKHYEI
jgi:hypothetical protein